MHYCSRASPLRFAPSCLLRPLLQETPAGSRRLTSSVVVVASQEHQTLPQRKLHSFMNTAHAEQNAKGLASMDPHNLSFFGAAQELVRSQQNGSGEVENIGPMLSQLAQENYPQQEKQCALFKSPSSTHSRTARLNRFMFTCDVTVHSRTVPSRTAHSRTVPCLEARHSAAWRAQG